MASKRKLRPINETRINGKLTSETARRLLSRRGGLARAQQQAADGYSMLKSMLAASIASKRLNAAIRKDARERAIQDELAQCHCSCHIKAQQAEPLDPVLFGLSK